MDKQPLYFVPVILRRTYARRGRKPNYVATLTLLTEEDGTIVAAGVGFQGYEYDGRKVTHSSRIGRNVAVGRAVKALVEGNHNSFAVDCPQLRTLVRDIGVDLFLSHMGVAPTFGQYPALPPALNQLVQKATKGKTRIAVYNDKRWKFVNSRNIL